MKKYVYSFLEGNKSMRELLGGKGANLAEMLALKLPIPHGFIVTTEACNEYYKKGEELSDTIIKQILEQVIELEKITNKKACNPNNPLLFSVRSGSRVSMPGMMDTILNLGINDKLVKEYIAVHGDGRFIYDSYRRFIQMYSDVVKGLPLSQFEEIIATIKQKNKLKEDRDLTTEHMEEIVIKFKELYFELTKEQFPEDPKKQLIESIKAVFRSWNNERAIIYRKMHNIPNEWGTGVIVQEMVYGNRNDNCGTGVVFSRNPATGNNNIYGEYLINAQGEDVVAGIRTPLKIETLEGVMPNVYKQLVDYTKLLEHHYLDMQDIEFTIENGKLYLLQTRNGKRTTQAALKIVLDMIDEGLITKEQAIMKIEPNQLEHLLHSVFDGKGLEKVKPIAQGLPASPGACSGKVYFTPEDVIKMASKGEDVILVREDTSPEDIEGMKEAVGILTIRGGMTSHAAVVARGMGKCCISGCNSLMVNLDKKVLTTEDGKKINEGEYISLDGATGFVYIDKMEITEPKLSHDFERFLELLKQTKKLTVKANADNEKDAKLSLKLGAEGIGLCRTEHMFFDQERILIVRKMIITEDELVRKEALNELLPMQREDFEKIFTVMNDKVVTIRYLDPPLHEFLPTLIKDIKLLAQSLKTNMKEIEQRIETLKEVNPMMGHRGCRLSVTYPEIAEMQTRAIIEATINVSWLGINVEPELMIPLISDNEELKYIKKIIIDTASEVMEEFGVNVKYKIGTMIETPRACVLADELAKEVSFFSFGTNDLTQMTYGFSRDDASKFINDYCQKGIFKMDPFITIDKDGVGRFVELATLKGRSSNKEIELGICGEHGGESNSIEFFHQVGLDYVSCSPYRVPIAFLAAAQAAIKQGGQK